MSLFDFSSFLLPVVTQPKELKGKMYERNAELEDNPWSCCLPDSQWKM